MPNYRRVYLDNHYYFITSVVKDRSLPLLTDNIKSFKLALQISKKHYKYTIHAIVVMPDHFHMIICPKNKGQYPEIVSNIKREFTKNLKPELKNKLSKNLSTSQIKHRESGVWQRRYYEHTIRDQSD